MSTTGEYLPQKQGPTENSFFENMYLNFIYLIREGKREHYQKNQPISCREKNDPLKARCTELHAALTKKIIIIIC